QDNLTALQLGMRGYVTLHDTNALASYEICRGLEPELFAELVRMTSDNPKQREALKSISGAMDDVLAYDERMLRTYEQQGFAGISKSDATGEGRKVFGAAVARINTFSGGEQGLLSSRTTIEEADSSNAAHLLIFGSVLAALLLFVANSMASRELGERQR